MTTMLEPPSGGHSSAPDSASAARAAARTTARTTARATARPTGRARPAVPAPRRTQRDPLPWVVAIGMVTIGLWALTGGAESLVGGGIDTMLGISRLSGLVAALAALLGIGV